MKTINKIKRYILTGTPGSGKTTLIRYLESLGHKVVEEAATDVIRLMQTDDDPSPWVRPDFIEKIAQLQIQRREKLTKYLSTGAQFFDRSPLCTLALAKYLNHPLPPVLSHEIELIQRKNIYQRQVFFIENLGHCQPTEARTISFEEALRFEKIHEAVYLEYGFELIRISNCSVSERAELILSAINGHKS